MSEDSACFHEKHLLILKVVFESLFKELHAAFRKSPMTLNYSNLKIDFLIKMEFDLALSVHSSIYCTVGFFENKST